MPSRYLIPACCCLWMALGTIPGAVGDTIAVGVNVVNPQRLGAADQDAVLDQLQGAGVRIIRVPLAPPWDGDDYRPSIDFIGRAYQRGIKAGLIIGLQYSSGAQRRPAVQSMPDMWPGYPLSSADPARFRVVFEPLFNELENLQITFAALELGNEINWAAFNGEFPIPGQGRVFSGEDLVGDPEARQVAAGYRAYLRTLSVLKDIRDHSRLNRETPIVSAGLADPGRAGLRPGTKTDAVTIAATLQYLREKGMDLLVDAYGVHTYPWAKTAAGRLRQLENDTLAECKPPGQGKPCWLTEWGLANRSLDCPGNDMPRAAMVRELLAEFGQFAREGRLKGLIYFSWNNRKYGIYRCGALTESGALTVAGLDVR